MPPLICRNSRWPRSWTSIVPSFNSRTFAFHFGLVVRISNASGVKSGAMIASTNRSGSAKKLGRRRVDRHVETEHRAERAQRIAFPGAAHRVAQRFRRRRAARVVVLEHRDARDGQRPHDGQRAVEVQEVVVRQLFAVQLFGPHERTGTGIGKCIQCRHLVRVLAVAECLY